MNNINREYESFVRIVCNDSPYAIKDYFMEQDVKELFIDVYNNVIKQHSKIRDKYYSKNGKGIINMLFLDHYLILCYRFANALFRKDKFDIQLLDAIYYSSKIRTSADLFYNASIGDYFLPTHPLGTIITSQSTYGKCFKVYGSVLIGPLEQPFPYSDKKASDTPKPVIGDGVIVFNHAKILGNSIIGNNVTISAGCVIQNREIPDNTLAMIDQPSGRLVLLPNKSNNLSILRK